MGVKRRNGVNAELLQLFHPPGLWVSGEAISPKRERGQICESVFSAMSVSWPGRLPGPTGKTGGAGLSMRRGWRLFQLLRGALACDPRATGRPADQRPLNVAGSICAERLKGLIQTGSLLSTYLLWDGELRRGRNSPSDRVHRGGSG